MAYITMFLLSIVLFLPSGSRRLFSTMQIHEASINHRLVLWRGACGLTAMHPLNGWKSKDCGKLYAQWYCPKQITENYRTMINDFLTISVRYGLLFLFFLLIIIFIVLWLAGRIAYTLHDKILAALVCSCLSYLFCASFSTLYEQSDVVSWFLCLIIVTICYAIRCCTLEKNKIQIYDYCIPVISSLLVCGTIWVVGYFVNSSMPFQHFEYWQLQHGIDDTFVLTAFPHHTPKALILFYLPSNQFNEDENIYGLPSYRDWLKDGYAIMSVALESGLRGFEKSKLALEKSFEIAGDLPVLSVGVGITGNYAIINSNENAKASGLCGFIGINSSIDWPIKKLSPLVQVGKIAVPGYLIDDNNGVFDVFLQKSKVEGKSIQGLHLPENTNCMTLREKTTAATPLALQLAMRLLTNVSSP